MSMSQNLTADITISTLSIFSTRQQGQALKFNNFNGLCMKLCALIIVRLLVDGRNSYTHSLYESPVMTMVRYAV
jgi:hypothetical protein